MEAKYRCSGQMEERDLGALTGCSSSQAPAYSSVVSFYTRGSCSPERLSDMVLSGSQAVEACSVCSSLGLAAQQGWPQGPGAEFSSAGQPCPALGYKWQLALWGLTQCREVDGLHPKKNKSMGGPLGREHGNTVPSSEESNQRVEKNVARGPILSLAFPAPYPVGEDRLGRGRVSLLDSARLPLF